MRSEADEVLRGHCQIASEPNSYVQPLLPVGAATRKGTKNEVCIAVRDGAGLTCRNQDNFVVGRIPVKTLLGEIEEWRIFAVLDGHGLGKFSSTKRDGDFYADAAARLLIRNVSDALTERRHRTMLLSEVPADVHAFFQLIFVGIDSTLRLPRGGSTLTMLLHDVTRRNVYAAFVGDSLGVFLKKQPEGDAPRCDYQPYDMFPEPHRPTFPRERARLTSMGYGRFINCYGRLGPVLMAGATGGYGLAVSKSLGDYCVVNCGKSAIPDVGKWKISDGVDFALLATDGLWDVFNEAEAVRFVADRLDDSKNPSACLTKIAKELAQHVSEKYTSRFGASDDTTVMIVDLRTPQGALGHRHGIFGGP